MAAVIELKKRGFDDIVVLEKADDVGGVWRENTYPGAACDVPSPFYSYSFEPNPRCGHWFSRQPAHPRLHALTSPTSTTSVGTSASAPR